MDTIIVDLDGTLANCDHRIHHIKTKPKNWKAFNAGYRLDTLIVPVFNVVCALQKRHNIVLLTGREGSEQGKRDTLEWLNSNGIFHAREKDATAKLFYHEFIMRESGDYRPDYEMKLDALTKLIENGYNPTIAFDDRKTVIKTFRAQGLYVFDCGQSLEE